MADDELQIVFESSVSGIDARALLAALQDMLEALVQVERNTSPSGEATVRWMVTEASTNSPLRTVLRGRPTTRDDAAGRRAADTLFRGLEVLRRSDDCPSGFDDEVLRHIQNLGKGKARGLVGIEIGFRGRTVRASDQVRANAAAARKKTQLRHVATSRTYEEIGTIEGRLRTLADRSGGDTLLAIEDELTGRKTNCYFADRELDEQARGCWKRRVAVTGRITFLRATGQPESVRVERIDALREREELPSVRALPAIDLTDGLDSASFVEGLYDDRE